MEHTNPTLLAATQCSGGPCRNLTGAMPLEWLSHAERVQLSESARFSLDEEISMLRKLMKNFVRAVGTGGEDDYPDHLAKSLDLLGLTCSRLASVLRVNMTLNGGQEDELRRQIETSLAAFLSETQAEQRGAGAAGADRNKEVKDAAM